jgi:hypothetical protein
VKIKVNFNQTHIRFLPELTICLYMAVMLFFALTREGTGDEGDSVMHYLFSKYAFQHPENFLNHWAKPLFVVLSAPFAQLGFVGIKVFNIMMFSGAAYLAYKTAKIFNIPWSGLVPLVLFCAPMGINQVLSGLTEPTFAFWLMASIYLFAHKKPYSAAAWLSFLPFIRSEGLVVICVVIVYMVIKKYWKQLPLLVIGHLVFSIAGFLLYRDILWVFNKIPYATLDGAYGAGDLLHFIVHMNQVITPFQAFLLCIGIVTGIWGTWLLFRNKLNAFLSIDEWLLIYGIFIGYFTAHTLFWYLGIFNSYGLMRVMIGVLPLMAIIMLRGIWLLASMLSRKSTDYRPYLYVSSGILLLISVVSYGNWDHYLGLSGRQIALQKAFEETGKLIGDAPVYCSSPSAAYIFEANWFDPSSRRYASQVFTPEWIPPGSLIVWDDHFAQIEDKVDIDRLRADPRFSELGFYTHDEVFYGVKRSAAVFKYTGDSRPEGMLLFADFEATDLYQGLDSTYAFEGNYSQRIDANNQFSYGFVVYLNGIYLESGAKIKCSFQLYCPEENDFCPGILIFSHENHFLPFDYKSFSLSEFAKKGEWVSVEKTVEVLPFKNMTDHFKLYLWNTDSKPVFIDNLKIEWIRE